MNLHCYRKKAYTREQDALAVVYRLRAQGSDVSAYLCDICKQWHLRASKPVPEPRAS